MSYADRLAQHLRENPTRFDSEQTDFYAPRNCAQWAAEYRRRALDAWNLGRRAIRHGLNRHYHYADALRNWQNMRRELENMEYHYGKAD